MKKITRMQLRKLILKEYKANKPHPVTDDLQNKTKNQEALVIPKGISEKHNLTPEQVRQLEKMLKDLFPTPSKQASALGDILKQLEANKE